VPDGYNKSITHIEYDEAQKFQLRSLIYILDENHPIPPKNVETGPGAKKLQEFKEQLMKDHVVSFFTTPEDLQAKIMHDVPSQFSQMGVAVQNASDQIELGTTRNLHEQQFLLLSKLVRRLQDGQMWFQRATSALRLEGEQGPKEQASLAEKAMSAADDEFLNGKLLLPEALANLVEHFFIAMSQGQSRFALAVAPLFEGYAVHLGHQRAELWNAAAKVAYEQLPEILRQIEETARDIIGVAKPT
jgi:hypothetical protein